jgi:hypothetical protein
VLDIEMKGVKKMKVIPTCRAFHDQVIVNDDPEKAYGELDEWVYGPASWDSNTISNAGRTSSMTV